MTGKSIGIFAVMITCAATAAETYYFGPPKEGKAVTNRKFTGIPSLCVTPKGRLWATWYAGPTPGEDANNYIVLSTSADGGKSWKEVMVADPDGKGPGRNFDANLWVTPGGKLQWNWAESIQKPGCEPAVWTFVRYGDDPESETMNWSKPVTVGKGIAMGKTLRLSTGEWAMPVSDWFAEPSALMYVSSDDGRTWEKRGGAAYPAIARMYDEHQFVECADGTIRSYSRTWPGIGMSVSRDRGRTWSPGEFTWIPQPNSRFFVRRLKSGRLLLVKHGPMKYDWRVCGRERLTAFLSGDDGKTWQGGLMLDERTNISYPDGDQAADGSIYVIHDRERTGAREILCSHFTEEDVLAGKMVSKDGFLKRLISKGSYVEPAGQP